LHCGVQIQNFDHDERRGLLANGFISAGTLGCFIEKSGEIALLSNNHIVGGSNLAAMNDRILHAGASKWGVNSTWVASLAGRVPLIPTPPSTPDGSRVLNTADAAYAVLQGGIDYEAGFRPGLECPEIIRVGEAVVTAPPLPLQQVFKVGRTTGKRSGVVEAINAFGPLYYPGLGECWFQDIVRVRGTGGKPFAEAGDSGSLVVDDRGGAIGPVFAADTQLAYVCPLRPILQQLKCNLMTRNGPVGPDEGRRTRPPGGATIEGGARWAGRKK
jgi:hypothetical protein